MDSELKIGDVLRMAMKDYIKVSILGTGSYGEVSSFWCTDSGTPLASRLVALKVPLYHRGRALASLEMEMHTLIKERSGEKKLMLPTVQLLYSEQQGREMLCLMEHFAGTLSDLEAPMTAKDVFYVSKQLLEKLNILHTTSLLVHNDLKPENVFIGFSSEKEKNQHAAFLVNKALTTSDLGASQKHRLADIAAILRAEGITPREVNVDLKITSRHVVIGDVGLASPINKVPGGLTGTMGYLSPESMAGGVVSYKSDVFSAGITICEIFLGKKLLEVEGETLRKEILNLLHQLSNLKGPMSEVVVNSFKKKAQFFDGYELKPSDSSPQLPKLERLIGDRCKELSWKDDDARRICDLVSRCLLHNVRVRSVISTLLTKLSE